MDNKPELTWWNVAEASTAVLVAGEYKKKEKESFLSYSSKCTLNALL
jgi:hypothetical protein